jgi:prostaglandin-H2 D-isomerase / glutathione transferase
MKLTYFELSGSRGEECRIALQLAGCAWEDVRLTGPQWREAKPTSPWGGLPTLEVDGRVLAQSNAILAYIGLRFGLLPADPFEAARHLSVLEAVEQIRSEFTPALRETDPARKAALREAFAEEALPRWGARLSREVRGPFVGGETMGVADAKLYIIVRWFRMGVLDHVPTACLDACPVLIAHQAAVEGHPVVAAWQSRKR